MNVELHGVARRRIIAIIATTYAKAEIESDLHPKAANAPWLWLQQPYAKWYKECMARRIDFKRSLASLIGDVPPVPAIEWPPYDSGSNKRPQCYLSEKATRVAKEYALEILKGLKL